MVETTGITADRMCSLQLLSSVLNFSIFITVVTILIW